MDHLVIVANKEMLIYVLSTAILVLLVVIIRMGIHHTLFEGTDISVQSRRQWGVTIRNILLVIFILGIGFISAPKIQTFAVSLLAIALAVVIATKEFLPVLAVYLTTSDKSLFSR